MCAGGLHQILCGNFTLDRIGPNITTNLNQTEIKHFQLFEIKLKQKFWKIYFLL